MPLDAPLLSLMLLAGLVGLVLDCNRRVRELQRTTDLHTRWLDHLIRQGTPPATE